EDVVPKLHREPSPARSDRVKLDEQHATGWQPRRCEIDRRRDRDAADARYQDALDVRGDAEHTDRVLLGRDLADDRGPMRLPSAIEVRLARDELHPFAWDVLVLH